MQDKCATAGVGQDSDREEAKSVWNRPVMRMLGAADAEAGDTIPGEGNSFS